TSVQRSWAVNRGIVLSVKKARRQIHCRGSRQALFAIDPGRRRLDVSFRGRKEYGARRSVDDRLPRDIRNFQRDDFRPHFADSPAVQDASLASRRRLGGVTANDLLDIGQRGRTAEALDVIREGRHGVALSSRSLASSTQRSAKCTFPANLDSLSDDMTNGFSTESSSWLTWLTSSEISDLANTISSGESLVEVRPGLGMATSPWEK